MMEITKNNIYPKKKDKSNESRLNEMANQVKKNSFFFCCFF